MNHIKVKKLTEEEIIEKYSRNEFIIHEAAKIVGSEVLKRIPKELGRKSLFLKDETGLSLLSLLAIYRKLNLVDQRQLTLEDVVKIEKFSQSKE